MKKTLLKVASLLALAATLCLTACSSAVTAYDDELAAPEAKLYAYPGVNIISWAAIPNADSYQIWRTVGDAVATVFEAAGGNNQVVVYRDADVKLEDTVYTYRIIAIANTPNGVGIMDRTSEVTVSMTTPTALTADELAEEEPNYAGRFAPFFTSYSDLAKYEADYDADAEVLAPETIKVDVDANYDVVVTFPTKPYAYYEVYYVNDGDDFATAASYTEKKSINGFEWPNKAVVHFAFVNNNVSNVIVKAIPYNCCYSASTVTAATKVQTLRADFTITGMRADYTDASKGKARLTFNVSKLNGEDVPASAITVYRKTSDSQKPWNDTIVALGNPTLGTEDIINNADPTLGAKPTSLYYFDDASVPVTKNVTYTYYVKAVYNGKLVVGYNNNTTPTIGAVLALPSSTIDALYQDPYTGAGMSFSTITNGSANKTYNFTLTSTYPKGKANKDELFYKDFASLNEAKAASLEEIDKVEPLEGTETSDDPDCTTQTVLGVETQTYTKTYKFRDVASLEAAVIETSDGTSPNETYKFEVKPNYRVYKYVVTEADGTVLIKTRGVYFTQTNNSSGTTTYSLVTFNLN